MREPDFVPPISGDPAGIPGSAVPQFRVLLRASSQSPLRGRGPRRRKAILTREETARVSPRRSHRTVRFSFSFTQPRPGIFMAYTPEECLGALRQVATELDTAPTMAEYDNLSNNDQPTSQTIANKLDTWRNALNELDTEHTPRRQYTNRTASTHSKTPLNNSAKTPPSTPTNASVSAPVLPRFRTASPPGRPRKQKPTSSRGKHATASSGLQLHRPSECR